MNYEQKYNEVLQKAKEEYNRLGELGNESMKRRFEIIFPELRESEDERIRKQMMEFISSADISDFVSEVQQAEWYHWLEKQKEQKPFSSYDMAKCFIEGQDYVIKHPEKFGLQKPAEWSEEDKEAIIVARVACQRLDEDEVPCGYKMSFGRADEHLKSLRPQPKVEWSEEDKALFGLLHQCVCRCVNDDRMIYSERERISKTMFPFIEKLQTLRPQPKEEWSEEDEVDLNDAIKYVQNYGETSSDEYARLRTKEIVDWLKSLSYRFSLSSWGEEIRDAFFGVERNWKPSEEQMDSLRDTIIQTKGYSYSMYLPELYEQLKKLM